VGFADTRAMLEATIDLVDYLVDKGYTPYGADVAARRLLQARSGLSHGVGTPADVEKWRDWLAGWEG
jgi:hypothetical protein